MPAFFMQASHAGEVSILMTLLAQLQLQLHFTPAGSMQLRDGHEHLRMLCIGYTVNSGVHAK